MFSIRTAFRFLVIFLCVWVVYIISFKVYHPAHIFVGEQKTLQPSILPNAQHIDLSSVGFENNWVDMYWLALIQYVWAHVNSGLYGQYLFRMIDTITDIAPSFSTPYELGMLLLSWLNTPETLLQAQSIGQKGLANLCHIDIADLQEWEQSFWEIFTKFQWKKICESYKIPYFYAFLESEYFSNIEDASYYYLLAALHDDAPRGAARLAGVLQSKAGEYKTSFLNFLSLIEVSSANTFCRTVASESIKAFLNNKLITSQYITQYEFVYMQLNTVLDTAIIDNRLCMENANKALQSLHLAYIHQQYLVSNHTFKTVEEWFQKGFLSFVPIYPNDEYEYHFIDGIWTTKKSP